MKEQSLVEMKNKVEALIRVLQNVMDEQKHLTVLAAGTLETIKLMPGYDDAIEVMTEKAKLEREDNKPKPVLNT
jgi:peptidyl-tRNA hydrolase